MHAKWEAVRVDWNPDTWMVIERDGDTKRRIAVFEPSQYVSGAECEVNAKGVALMRNADDVMQRRGWGFCQFMLSDGRIVWRVLGEGLDSATLRNMPRLRDCPFTALAEADEWMKSHIEGK